jgi:flagellar motor protein MotB
MKPHSLKSALLGRSKAKSRKDEGENHIWAVSYSDLLMVLMSFFILFFQVDKKDDVVEKTKMNQVIMAVENQFGQGAGHALVTVPPVVTSPPVVSASQATTPDRLSSVKTALKEMNLKFDASSKDNFVTVDLEYNLYSPGEFKLSKRSERPLDHLFNTLKPYLADLSLEVIGHTDSVPRSQSGKKFPQYLNSNLALSDLRALGAAEYLIQLGVPPEKISTHGSDHFSRNTRSVSIRLYSKETE